nr:PREDICTED: cytochrome P450 9e2-like isoform X1 [Bemisia tabaci]
MISISNLTALLSIPCLCLIFLSISFYVYLRATISHHSWKKRGIPLLDPVPFFGQWEFSRIFHESYFEIINRLYEGARSKGLKYCCIFQFSTPTLMLLDPQIIGSILTKDFAYFSDRFDLQYDETQAISQQLFSVSTADWKEISKRVSPVVSPGRIGYLVQEMENIDKDVIFNDVPSVVSTDQFAFKFNQMVMGLASLGSDLARNASSVLSTVKNMIDHCFYNFFIFYAPLVLPSLRKSFFPKIDDEELCSMVRNVSMSRENIGDHRNDVFQFFMDAQAKQEKRNKKSSSSNSSFDVDIITVARRLFWFLMDSQGTSTVALSFVLHLISLHPECQEKIKQELERVMEERGEQEVTYSVVRDLKYTHTVIKECLRLYTPMSVLQRVCTRDYLLPGSSVVIPKGTKVIIPIYSIQRDPQYFPEPFEFRPDRFHDVTKIAPYTFMPFGEGPRFCIGYRFAMAHLKYTIATLVSKFHIEAASTKQNILALHPFSPAILRSKKEIMVRFRKRFSKSEESVT